MPFGFRRTALTFNSYEYAFQRSGGCVRWQYWSGGLIVSVLIHLVVFWPVPNTKNERMKAAPFSVRFVPIVVPEPDVRFDCCEARLLQNDDVPVLSGAADMNRQQNAIAVRREGGTTTDRLGMRGMPPAVIENSIPATGAPERVVVERSSDEGPGGALARYRLGLAAAAVRMQTYPRAAMAAGLEGTVLIDVRLTGESVPPLITVGRSSGVEELDREAVLLLTRAMMTLPVWRAPMAEGAVIRLPVSFELKTR
jgi:TonB family protein